MDSSGLTPLAYKKGEHMTRQNKLQNLITAAEPAAMRSARSRKALAHKIATELGLWEPTVLMFVDEMVGLSFYNTDDRQTFIQFFCYAYRFDV